MPDDLAGLLVEFQHQLDGTTYLPIPVPDELRGIAYVADPPRPGMALPVRAPRNLPIAIVVERRRVR